MNNICFDVVIIGSGPAGTLLALACVARNLNVAIVSIGGIQASPNTLCAFASQIPEYLTKNRWKKTQVQFQTHCIELPEYVEFDAEKAAAEAKKVTTEFDGRVVAIEHDDINSVTTVLCDNSLHISGRIIVDCSGPKSELTERENFNSPLARQNAYGIRFYGEDPIDEQTALFMDWTENNSPPSFLYGMKFSDGSILLEETSLAHRPGLPIAELKERLFARMKQRGTKIESIVHEECVSIPLDLPWPKPNPYIVAFGSCASFVAPTTGFQIATAYARAHRVARYLQNELPRRSSPSFMEGLVECTFTQAEKATHHFQLFALEAALSLRTASEASEFFGTFFTNSADAFTWLQGNPPPIHFLKSMMSMFTRSSWPLKQTLLHSTTAYPQFFRGMSLFPFSSSSSDNNCSR